MALRTTAVAAGMVDIMRLATVITLAQVPSQALRATVAHRLERSPMAGEPIPPEPGPVGPAITPKDLRSRRQVRAASAVAIGHAGSDGGVHDVPGRGRQRRVAGRGPQAPMTQPCLHDPPRHPPLHERGRRGVPPGRDGGLCGDPTLAHHRCEGLLQGGGGPGPRPLPGRASPGAGPPELPVLPSKLQGPFGQGYIAVFAPLALADPDQQALGVDSRDLQRCPIPEAKPARVEHPPTPPSFRGLDQGQQGPDLARTPHDGQFWGAPGSHEVADWPRALQRPLGEAPDPLEVQAEGALGDCLLVQPEEELMAELRFAALVGSASIVASPLLNSGDRTRLGLGGKPLQWQVFEHTASEGSHRDPPVRGGHDRSQKAYGEQEDTGSLRSAKEGEKDSDLDRID
jgi:hypothetical protein